MIQTIGIETLRILVEEPDMIVDRHEEVKEILSNVLEYEDSEAYESQPMSVFSETGQSPKHHKETDPGVALPELPASHFDRASIQIPDPGKVVPTPEETSAPLSESVDLSAPSPPEIEIPTVSPDELPARALYKKFQRLGNKRNFRERNRRCVLTGGTQQLRFGE